MPESIVEGQTAPIIQQLFSDGVVKDCTGLSLSLSVFDNSDQPVTLPGVVSFFAIALGKVQYAPTGVEFLRNKSPYRARWRLQGSDVAFYPNDIPDFWTVRS